MNLIRILLRRFRRPAAAVARAPTPRRLQEPAPAVAEPPPREEPQEEPRPEAPAVVNPRLFQLGIIDRGSPLGTSDGAFLAAFQELLDRGRLDLVLPPAAAIDVMRLVDNPRTTVQNLAVAIAADPAVAGSVLKLANSPLYRGSFVIANLHQAVVRLGMRNLRSMLLAVVLNSTRVKGKPFQSYSTLTWKHSLLCAQICSELARESKLDPEHAYMAGLFHNVGVLAVLSAARKLAVRQQKKISAHGVLELLSRHAYALNGTVIREWNLLDEIVTAVTGYRSWQEMPQDGDTPAPGTRYAALVDLSNALCKHYGIWVEYDHIAMAEHPAMEFLGLAPEALPARDWVLATSAKIERAAGVV